METLQAEQGWADGAGGVLPGSRADGHRREADELWQSHLLATWARQAIRGVTLSIAWR